MKPRQEARPIDPPYYTDDELAPWFRCFRGTSIQYRNVFANTYRMAELRDAYLMYTAQTIAVHGPAAIELFGIACRGWDQE